MDLLELGKLVVKAAPLLGSVLAGPSGGVVGALIAQVFGANPQDQNDIINKINADPDSALKLRQIELQHIETLHSIYSNDYAKSVDDRFSARNREIEFMKISGKHDWVLPSLAIFSVSLFAAAIIIILFTKMDLSDHDVLYMMLGQLSTLVLMVYGYYFGSMYKKFKYTQPQSTNN